jgi:hypothetical protein
MVGTNWLGPFGHVLHYPVRRGEQRTILKLIFGRQVMGRPFAAPPGVPKDRVDALRKAFMETMADKAFLAEAEKAKLEMTPASGDKSRS